MIDEKLSAALALAKEKENFGEISNEYLAEIIYGTLLFELPSLKKEEVDKVLNSSFVGISAEKVQNITNQKNAFNKVVQMAKENAELDENALKDLHQILAEGMPNVGGLYRNVNISVKGSSHTPCSHEKVYDRMDKYFAFLADEPKGNLMEYIAYSHVQLAKIHPFLDCNGRLARLVLNYELIKHGFMPVVIKAEDHDKYIAAIETFKVEKEILPFVNFLTELEINALK